MARRSAPAATGGDCRIRRGCQWVPGQAGDDGREGGKAGVTWAAGMTAEGKAKVAPAPYGGGIGRCCPPFCPLSGTSPPQGGRGVREAMPAFLSFRTGCGATDTRSPPCPRSASSLLPTTLNRNPTRRPSPPPERSAERGPSVARAGVEGARRSPAGPIRKRQPRPPLMAKGFAPAATGGAGNTRRGCQWIPGQAGDDGRELGKERAAHLARAGQPASVTTGQRTRCQSLDRRR